MRLVIPNNYPGIEHLADAVRAFVRDLPPRAAYAVQLVTEEITTNIVKYGYGMGEQRTIAVELEPCADGVTIRFEDDGEPFDPTKPPPVDVAARLEEGLPGGLGLHLVQRFAASLVYRREDGKNKLEALIRT